MSEYCDRRYYCWIRDRYVSRVSMADSRGSEFFMTINDDGRGYREARNAALDEISYAISMGHTPGEVTARQGHEV